MMYFFKISIHIYRNVNAKYVPYNPYYITSKGQLVCHITSKNLKYCRITSLGQHVCQLTYYGSYYGYICVI